jgi:hypothetical protein
MWPALTQGMRQKKAAIRPDRRTDRDLSQLAVEKVTRGVSEHSTNLAIDYERPRDLIQSGVG